MVLLTNRWYFDYRVQYLSASAINMESQETHVDYNISRSCEITKSI